jgi:hypothetical protein
MHRHHAVQVADTATPHTSPVDTDSDIDPDLDGPFDGAADDDDPVAMLRHVRAMQLHNAAKGMNPRISKRSLATRIQLEIIMESFARQLSARIAAQAEDSQPSQHDTSERLASEPATPAAPRGLVPAGASRATRIAAGPAANFIADPREKDQEA